MTRPISKLSMSDEQIIKVFSIRFMADIISSVHHEIFHKGGNIVLFTQDRGKYIAFIMHITEIFDHLSAEEKLIVKQAVNKIIEIQEHFDINYNKKSDNDKLDFKIYK